MAHSASATGLLYGMAESGPTLAAQIGEIESGTQIDALAREYLIAETQDRNVTIPESKTVTASQTATDAPRPWDALSSRGERLHRVVLTHRTGAVVAITGLAVLLVSPGASFRYPAELATQISRMASRWCRAESRLRPMD
jgi:hypothetical protein